jgi:putative acetyltransferase
MTGDDETTAGADRDIPDVPVSGSGSVEDPPRWMPRLRVRPAVPDDAEELHSLSTASIRRAAASHYSAAELEAWVATRSVAGHRRMLERTAAFVVVDETEDMAGFATVALQPTGTLERGEVDQLFVSPEHGGRGAARLLLATVEATARDAGVTSLSTHASWRAVPVFERLGFTRVEVETVPIGDQVLTRVLMRKRL